MNIRLSIDLITYGFILLSCVFSSLCFNAQADTQTGQDSIDKKQSFSSGSETSSDTSFYVIKQGDTLYSVARKTTGNSRNWQHIASYNQINDPTEIRIGQEIHIPALLDSQTSVKRIVDSSDKPLVTLTQPQKQRGDYRNKPEKGESKASVSPFKGIAEPTSVSETEGGWIVVKGSYYPREINEKPDPSSDILIQVWPGTRLNFVQRKDGWYEVNTSRGIGYVNPAIVQRE